MNGWKYDRKYGRKYDRKDSRKYGKNDRKYGRRITGNLTEWVKKSL